MIMAPGPTVKMQKQPECRRAEGWIKEVGSTDTRRCQPPRKLTRDATAQPRGSAAATTRSEVSEERRDKRHAISLRAGVSTWTHTNLLRKRKQPHRLKQETTVTKGKVCGREKSADGRTQTHCCL